MFSKKVDTNEKRKKMWDNKMSKDRNNSIFLLLFDIRQKVVMKFSELQIF